MDNILKTIRKILKEEDGRSSRYMFFSNLEQMRRQCDLLLDLDEKMVESILDNGHDWAQDHIAEAKNNMDQVFDFLMNQSKKDDMDSSMYDDDEESVVEESEITEKQKKNKPTNPALWQQCLSWAGQRYEVCPSAYCNGAAAKRYKSKGGKWKRA